MGNNKVLFLVFNDDRADNILMNAVNKSEKVEMRCVFRHAGLFKRAIRRAMILKGMPGLSVWFGPWYQDCVEYDAVVMAASKYTPMILKWIHRKKPQLKLVNYYWDKIKISGYPIVQSDAFENWSFDKEDCEEYSFKYNPQFFTRHLRLDDEHAIYDISFVGADREGLWTERVSIVNEIYSKVRDSGLKTYFYLVTDNAQADPEIARKDRMTEAEFMKVISNSRSIVDLVQPGCEWMTLRPLLALANKKKLITNYEQIKTYPFYDRRNIFLIGSDPFDQLEEFIKSDYSEDFARELDYYEADNWADRFK